jgi:hypothetical protein
LSLSARAQVFSSKALGLAIRAKTGLSNLLPLIDVGRTIELLIKLQQSLLMNKKCYCHLPPEYPCARTDLSLTEAGTSSKFKCHNNKHLFKKCMVAYF